MTWLLSWTNNVFSLYNGKYLEHLSFQLLMAVLLCCCINICCQWFSKYLFKVNLWLRGGGISSTGNVVSQSLTFTAKKQMYILNLWVTMIHLLNTRVMLLQLAFIKIFHLLAKVSSLLMTHDEVSFQFTHFCWVRWILLFLLSIFSPSKGDY